MSVLSDRRSSAVQVYLALGRLAGQLPSVRGKNRAFLGLYSLLGLRAEHIFVDAVLRHPARYRARLDLHSWLQRLAFVAGGYEPRSVALLRRLELASPGYLLDVGANVGLIALPIAALQRRGSSSPSVVCIEAIPDNVRALRLNIALNRFESRIQVIPLGVGDVQGVFESEVEGGLRDGEGTGTSNILPKGSTHRCTRVQVQVSTLDLLRGEGRLPPGCGVVKIDTDGYDLKVLQGGPGFLDSDRPVVFGEFAAHCMQWHGQTLHDVVQFAQRHDYLVGSRVGVDGTRFATSLQHREFVQDLLLVPRERAHHFSWCLV